MAMTSKSLLSDYNVDNGYIVGIQQALDGRSDRWEVTQSVLSIVEKQALRFGQRS